eukprot:COSAG02_NODE_30416_length_551_cov_1.325221_1_plen_53_part_01
MFLSGCWKVSQKPLFPFCQYENYHELHQTVISGLPHSHRRGYSHVRLAVGELC